MCHVKSFVEFLCYARVNTDPPPGNDRLARPVEHEVTGGRTEDTEKNLPQCQCVH
jgi:hypothetical protein